MLKQITIKVTLPLVTLICILQSSIAVKINGQRDDLRDEVIAGRELQDMSMPMSMPLHTPSEQTSTSNYGGSSSSSSSSSSKSSSNKSSKG
eukprot:CAMPEP_0198282528 /NCGR_PEP_ID=MMETSP1449-20131203/2320_1 /TAXON_ID=420275 /ORGANISM="Attheya septentrionalis, Strain CCMP2084" /LENGTH=90 /DNA_ID=CAMNT_0043978803 /DNA_START=38 /DNA_END=306 /DNA_ORIENTATION=-